MAQAVGLESNDFVKEYVRTSTRRMIVGTVICFAIAGLAFFISFPTCARTDTVVSVRLAGDKYYLTLEGSSGTFGLWTDTKYDPGDTVCVRPTFAQ